MGEGDRLAAFSFISVLRDLPAITDRADFINTLKNKPGCEIYQNISQPGFYWK